MKAALVINPASGNGRTGRRWPWLEKELRRGLELDLEYAFTQEPGHATRLARNLILEGVELVVSVGGDGTHNEVLNGFFHQGQLINPQAVMATMTMGTGGDFIKSLGWERSLAWAIEKINRGRVKALDVGLAEFQGLDGKPSCRYFLNVVDFGAGGAVVERVNRTSKALGGRLSFLWGIVATLLTYRNKTITYRIDGTSPRTSVLHNFIIGNGRYYGGGIKAVPTALLDDGWLDIVIMGDIGLLEAMVNLPRFRKGTHLKHPKITWARGKTIQASCPGRVFIDMDGECVGTLPARFQVLPRKVQFVV